MRLDDYQKWLDSMFVDEPAPPAVIPEEATREEPAAPSMIEPISAQPSLPMTTAAAAPTESRAPYQPPSRPVTVARPADLEEDEVPQIDDYLPFRRNRAARPSTDASADEAGAAISGVVSEEQAGVGLEAKSRSLRDDDSGPDGGLSIEDAAPADDAVPADEVVPAVDGDSAREDGSDQVVAEADLGALPVDSKAVAGDNAVSEPSEAAPVEAASPAGEPIAAIAEPVAVRTPARRIASPGRARQVRSPGRMEAGEAMKPDELWGLVPRHLHTLFAMQNDEVAQNSYKREFKESRVELISRLLDPTLSLEETARLLNVCPTTVRRYTNRGQLTHHRTQGDQRRFKLSDVLAFLDTSRD